MKIDLPNVTLIGVDCNDPRRLQQAMDISELGINFAKTKLLSSIKIDDPRFVKIPHVGTLEDYSRFCIEDLHKYVDTEFALIVEYDGFVLNPLSWKSEFLNYDYVGAPWRVTDWYVKTFFFPKELVGKTICGNSGFVLRSKKMLDLSSELFKNKVIKKVYPEDFAMSAWYRKEFEKRGIKFASAEVAKQFAREGDWQGDTKQFGFHSYKFTNIDDWFEKNKSFKLLYEIYKNTSKEHYQ